MTIRRFSLSILAISSPAAFAQLTWDPDQNLDNNGGNGIWDTTASNLWESGGANVAWTNESNAVFGDAGANYIVDIADGGVTVGNLTYEGSNRLLLRSVTDNLGVITIAAGGATWNTGGGEIEFHNIQTFDTPLSISNDDTLTVSGGGIFDAGEKADGANWTATGATLDFTEATVVRGNSSNIGQFGSVKLAGGSTFIQERNSGQTLITSGNTWELKGDVTFGNRYDRQSYMSGVISGVGRLIYKDGASQNDGFMRIDNAANTFSGGITVDAENNNTMVYLNNANDGVLGAVPASFDADNIILKNGGTLRSNQSLTTNANRGITLENGGILNISNSRTFTLGGAITGNGGLQIGYAGGNAGTLNLSGANASYTGQTQIFEGNVVLGATNSLGQGVLQLGGTEGFARLILNDQSQTFGGIYNTGNLTKQIVNRNSTTSVSSTGTLTLDVADGDDYTANNGIGLNATDDRGNFNIVKNGLGRQQLGNLQIGGDLSVNEGILQVGDSSGFSSFGNTSVTGGTLVIADDNTVGTSYATSGTGTLQIGNGATAGDISNVNVANEGAVVFSRSDASSYSGVISGTGSLKATGAGTHTLNTAQTYTGGTAIDNAVLTAGVANALSSSSVLTLGGAGSGTSAFEISGTAQQLGGLNIAAGTHTREVRNNGAEASLTINAASGESHSYTANFAGTGTINLVKTGDGTQTISRVGGHTTPIGTIDVNQGELIWSVTGGNLGVVNVGANGTLSGVGLIDGDATVAGNLNPGLSPGTMTFNQTLTLESTATLTLEFGSSSLYDILQNDGDDTFTAGGELALVLDGYTPTDGDSFLVLENWDSYAGTFNSVTGTTLPGGLEFDTSNLLTDGTLTVVTVPEPAAALLSGLGLLALMRRRR